MELMLLLAGLRRNGANKIHVILPYLCYMRMDRPTGDYKTTAAADVLQFLSHAGASTIHVLDPHSEILMGTVPLGVCCRTLTSVTIAEKVVDMLTPEKLVIVSPDVGALKRCKGFVSHFKSTRGVELELAVIDKSRKKPNEVESVELVVGSVTGKRCLILDDMVDTGVSLSEHPLQVGGSTEGSGSHRGARLRHPRPLFGCAVPCQTRCIVSGPLIFVGFAPAA